MLLCDKYFMRESRIKVDVTKEIKFVLQPALPKILKYTNTRNMEDCHAILFMNCRSQ